MKIKLFFTLLLTSLIVILYLVKSETPQLIDNKNDSPELDSGSSLIYEGEKHFKNCLLDYNEANNVSGWQWVAGSGADAAPYFRIFNPILQGEKFDKDGDYVKKWVHELKNVPKKFFLQRLHKHFLTRKP